MPAGHIEVRPLTERDLDAADHIMRVAFGTFLGAPDPPSFFGESELVRTRVRTTPDCAWVAELDGRVVGSVIAARWGSFGWFGPLTTHPDVWNRGIGTRLLEPVLDAFARWDVIQAALFTFPDSLKHVGLYQRHGFWPRTLIALLAKPVAGGQSEYSTFSDVGDADVLAEIRGLTDDVFPGLELDVEIESCTAQQLGDTVLIRHDGRLEGVAICHCGPGTEAGSGECFVKFGAVRPGPDAERHFDGLLRACEAFAVTCSAKRLTAGINTGRLPAYRQMLARGFVMTRMGLSMQLRPAGANYDGPEQFVIDDLR